MDIVLSQFYIEAGANFPFTHVFQQKISREISKLVETTEEFTSKYGADFTIIIRISAKTLIDAIEFRGPTIFKRDKDVEYTMFLPYTPLANEVANSGSYEAPFHNILEGAAECPERLGLECSKLRAEFSGITRRFLDDKTIRSTV